MMSRSLVVATAILLAAIFALGFYALHLKHSAELQISSVADAGPVAMPINGSNESVQLFIANDDIGGLSRQTVAVSLPPDPQQRARELLRALILQYASPQSAHRLGKGADVNSVFLVNDIAVVNVNAAFADTHPSGVLVEQLTLDSIAKTLAANVKGVSKLKLVVDGKERETLAGHADLANLYDVSSSMEAVK